MRRLVRVYVGPELMAANLAAGRTLERNAPFSGHPLAMGQRFAHRGLRLANLLGRRRGPSQELYSHSQRNDP